jgi:hypothetical protein
MVEKLFQKAVSLSPQARKAVTVLTATRAMTSRGDSSKAKSRAEGRLFELMSAISRSTLDSRA